MSIEFINRILGTESELSVSNRLENTEPSVIVKKDSTMNRPIPEKYRKDAEALQERCGAELSSLTGLSINLSLREALEIMHRTRHRVDAYQGLVSYLKREWNIELNIKSQKTKQEMP